MDGNEAAWMHALPEKKSFAPNGHVATPRFAAASPTPTVKAAFSRQQRSGCVGNARLLVAATCLSCVSQLCWFGSKSIHQIDYDAMAYTGIALKLKQGLFHSSINGFRSPLISWLIAVTPVLTVFQIGKLVTISAYLLILVLLYELTYRLWSSKIVAGTATLLFTLCRGITFDAVALISPDFLLTALVLVYFLVLLECLRRDRYWLLLGTVHALAFLAKAFALPWLALITVAAVSFSSGGLKRKTIRLAIAASLPMCMALFWASVLHSKYDVFTAGTQFKTNYLQWTVRANPDYRPLRYTVLRDTTEETDDHLVDDPMPPGARAWAYKLKMGQVLPAIVRAELRNIPPMTKELVILVNPGVVLAFLVLFAILFRRREAESKAEWAIAAIAVFASVALVVAYSMLAFDSRYLLPLVPVLIALGTRFLIPHPLYHQPQLRNISWVLVIVGVGASFAYRSSPFRVQTRDFQEVCYRAGAALARADGKTVVSVGSGPFPEHGVGWEAGYKAAYFGGKRLIATEDTLPSPDQLFPLALDLTKASPDALLIWGDDAAKRRSLLGALGPSFLLGNEIIDPELGDVGVVLFRRVTHGQN